MANTADLYAVIGNPIDQSKSPLIHTSFAHTAQQALQYTRIKGRIGHFAADVDAFRATGGRGMNVTAPFKLDAFAYATDLSERAKQAGAVNAMKFEGDKVYADNFDGIGLVRDVVHNLQVLLGGKRVLMLGAGGAVRGALEPFLQERPALFMLANRDAAKAAALLAPYAAQHNVRAGRYEDLVDLEFNVGFDVVLNATSSSLHAHALPVPASVFGPGCLAYDLTYGKGLTPFLKSAKAAGALQLADGVGMLAEQAAEAFAWWRGVRPQTDGVIKALTVPLV